MSKVTSIEEMEAAFGELPENYGTWGGFVEDLADNPVSRNLGTLGDDWGARAERQGRVYGDGIDSVSQVAELGMQGLGYGVDLAGGVIGTVMDTLVPGTPMRSVMEQLMETETAQDLVKKWEALPIETRDSLNSMGVALEMFPAFRNVARAFNQTAANSSSQVPDFYANPVAKAIGTFRSFALRGLPRAAKQTLTAQGQALERMGLPVGMMQEIQELGASALMLNSIKDKLKRKKEREQALKDGTAKPEDFRPEEWVLTPEERTALQRAWEAGKAAEKDKQGNWVDADKVHDKRKLASEEGLLSYIEAEMLKSYNIIKQAGGESPILEALVKPLTSYIGKMEDTVEIRRHLDPESKMPQGVYDRIMNDVHVGHGISGKEGNTFGVVRKAKGQSALSGEGQGQKGTPHGRLNDTLRNYVNETYHPQVKKLESTNNKIDKLQETINARGDKGPTAGQQKRMDALVAERDELGEFLRINGAVQKSQTIVGSLAETFPDGFPNTQAAVDFLRATNLKESKDVGTYSRLKQRQREGGMSLLTPAEQRKYNAILEKQAKYADKGKGLSKGDLKTLTELQNRMDEGRLPPKDQKVMDRIEEELVGADEWGKRTDNTLRVTGKRDENGNLVLDKDGYPIPDDDGFIYFVSGYHSSEKALGGVRSTTAFNPTTGETFVVISDGHDMFGVNPIGGSGLITIVEPFRWNAYDKRPSNERIGAEATSTYEEGIAEASRLTGVEPTGALKGVKAKGVTGMLYDIANQYSPEPTTGDYLRALSNQAQASTQVGLMAPQIYSGEETNE